MPKKSNFRTSSLATVFLCDMYKTKSKSSFWQTLNLLTGAEWRKTQRHDVDEWVDSVVKKREYDNILEDDEVQPASEIDEKVEDASYNESVVDRKEFFKSLDLPKIDCTYVPFK